MVGRVRSAVGSTIILPGVSSLAVPPLVVKSYCNKRGPFRLSCVPPSVLDRTYGLSLATHKVSTVHSDHSTLSTGDSAYSPVLAKSVLDRGLLRKDRRDLGSLALRASLSVRSLPVITAGGDPGADAANSPGGLLSRTQRDSHLTRRRLVQRQRGVIISSCFRRRRQASHRCPDRRRSQTSSSSSDDLGPGNANTQRVVSGMGGSIASFFQTEASRVENRVYSVSRRSSHRDQFEFAHSHGSPSGVSWKS